MAHNQILGFISVMAHIELVGFKTFLGLHITGVGFKWALAHNSVMGFRTFLGSHHWFGFQRNVGLNGNNDEGISDGII